MDQTLTTLMTIVGPIILLAIIVYVVAKGRKRNPGEASEETTERATRANYQREEQRRRDGIDDV